MRGINIGTGISTVAPTRIIAAMQKATIFIVYLVQPPTPLE